MQRADSKCAASNSSEDKIDGFLLEALRSIKDRTFVLKIEHTVLLFMADVEYLLIIVTIFLACRPVELEFPPMNSFYRMLAHHVAGYYNLGHFMDPASKCLVLQKNASSACPALRLFDLVEPVEQLKTLYAAPPMAMSSPAALTNESGMQHSIGDFKIMKRRKSAEKHEQIGNADASAKEKPSKTIDEREAEYAAARERIFQDFKPAEDDGDVIIQVHQPTEAERAEEIRPERKAPSTHFNPEAEPFIPSLARDEQQRPASPPTYPTRIINIIDPHQARAPEHVLVIASANQQRLELLNAACPGAVFRPRLNDTSSGYLIFPSIAAAKNALHDRADLGIAPWRPVITD